MVYDETRGGWPATLALYAAWLVTALGSVIDALAIREAVLAILSWYRVLETAAYHRAGGVGEDIFTGFGLTAVDDVILFFLGCGAVAATVGIEYYYRKGRPKGLLYKRIGKVLGIEIAIIIVAVVVRMLVSSILATNP